MCWQTCFIAICKLANMTNIMVFADNMNNQDYNH